MYIYNLTVQISEEVLSEFLGWLQQEQIPNLLALGCFSSAKLLRLLNLPPGVENTYAVQLELSSYDAFEEFQAQHAGMLEQEAREKWGDGFMAFSSLLEVVE